MNGTRCAIRPDTKFEVVFSYVLMVPTGAPQPVIEILRSEVTRVLASPDIRDRARGRRHGASLTLDGRVAGLAARQPQKVD
jgi:hypothetical protein